MFGAGQAKLRAEVYGELASMVAAGVTVGESVSAVADEMRPSNLSRALERVGRELSAGHSLSETMRAHEHVFSPLTIAMIEVGERTGRLEGALRSVADYYERDFELRHLLTRELAYPIVLFVLILFIPLVADVIRVWMTDSLLAALLVGVQGILTIAILIGVPVGIAALTIRALSGSRQGRRTLDTIKLNIPLIGGVMRKLALARFCRALASLYSSGVLMGTSVRLAGQVAGNEVLREEFTRHVRSIEGGASLSATLGESALMPRTVLRMLKTGERTGEIDSMAQNVADHLQQEAQTSIKQLAVMLTPISVIIAGVIVALMVIGFFADFYSSLLQ